MYESIRGCFFIFVNATGSFELRVEHSALFFNFKTHQVLFLDSSFTPNIASRDFSVGPSGCERKRDGERERLCAVGGRGVVFGFLWCKMSHANSQRRIPVRLVMRWEVDQSQTWRYEAVEVTTQRGPELLIRMPFVPSPTKLVFFWYLRLAISWRILCIKLIPSRELRMIQTL